MSTPEMERVRAYMAALAPDVRRRVKELRRVIHAAAPDAVEVFSYGIPGFRLNDRALVWYAGWKEHASLYPIGTALKRALGSALDGYETSKGTVRFPLSDPIPVRLVTRLVKGRIAEVHAARPRPRTSKRVR